MAHSLAASKLAFRHNDIDAFLAPCRSELVRCHNMGLGNTGRLQEDGINFAHDSLRSAAAQVLPCPYRAPPSKER